MNFLKKEDNVKHVETEHEANMGKNLDDEINELSFENNY